ncbi:hypothetical protein CRENBAI_023458 [Crenichthys baileyi]|uniref:Uncharacterized protein n=1 Tax=Crenichthys baileyi TaxID=28760 RepID=A0AAV9QZN1_9TELE
MTSTVALPMSSTSSPGLLIFVPPEEFEAHLRALAHHIGSSEVQKSHSPPSLSTTPLLQPPRVSTPRAHFSEFASEGVQMGMHRVHLPKFTHKSVQMGMHRVHVFEFACRGVQVNTLLTQLPNFHVPWGVQPFPVAAPRL